MAKHEPSGALLPPQLETLGPCVIGATGGSGTRVVARIVRRAGLFLGHDLNESEDAWRFGDYSDRWIDEFLRSGGAPSTGFARAMVNDLRGLLADHCAPIANEPPRWGWKEPRSIYLLPFLHRHLPALRFLHVVRDGRDMALSSNQNQLRKHGDAAPIPAEGSPAARSIALWSWVNLSAAEYGGVVLGARYLRVRFEDLCDSPGDTIGRILTFCELEGDAEALQTEVAAPPTLGRWRSVPAGELAVLECAGGAALDRFGYGRADAR